MFRIVILVILFTSLLVGQAPAYAAPIRTIGDSGGGGSALPVSGSPVPELQVFDQTMQQFMADRSIKAGVLVVMKDGVIGLEHGYGWKDKTLQTPLQPDAMFRLASVIKPVTQAAIKKLIAEGTLSASDPVFCLPGSPFSCRLRLIPVGTPDPRLQDITIQNLLDHEGGWDRDISGDPMFQSIQIANTLGVPGPPSKEDTTRYMMGRPLDHTPGTVYAYSNFGYMLLGLIIEKVTGQTYTAYIQDHIFNPLGVADTEIERGRTLPEFRNPREPWYSDPYIGGPNVFNPSEIVPWPDGGWYLEAMEAHGGMIATARAMAEFLQAYWINGEPRLGNGQTWWFYGSLDGTHTLAYQRPDGVNLVALFNQRADSSGLDYFIIKSLLDTATDSVVQWPTLTTFSDVPATYWSWAYIGRLYGAGITGGCATGPLRYCPEDTVTRAQMAVFLERGIHGSSYTPPSLGAGTGFGDVPPDYWSATFIKQLAAEGITAGCGNGNYCPEQPVTRAQMAVFLLRSKYGAGYTPPAVGAGTGFGDVPPDYWSAAFIKQLVTEGITAGCGGGN